MGFCTKEQHARFLELCPEMEKYIVEGGIQLIKIWLEVSDKEQKRRFEARMEDPLRQWKLSPMDLPSRTKWFEYSRARDMMLKATDTKARPWYILRSDDKKRARLNCIRAHPEPHPLQESAAREDRTAQALDEGRLRRPSPAEGPEVRAGEILNPNPQPAWRTWHPGNGLGVAGGHHHTLKHETFCERTSPWLLPWLPTLAGPALAPCWRCAFRLRQLP